MCIHGACRLECDNRNITSAATRVAKTSAEWTAGRILPSCKIISTTGDAGGRGCRNLELVKCFANIICF